MNHSILLQQAQDEFKRWFDGRNNATYHGKSVPDIIVAFAKEYASKETEGLRVLLAVCYAGGNLYSDDGELQDNRLPTIDFKRDSVETIKEKMTERMMAEIQDSGTTI